MPNLEALNLADSSFRSSTAVLEHGDQEQIPQIPPLDLNRVFESMDPPIFTRFGSLIQRVAIIYNQFGNITEQIQQKGEGVETNVLEKQKQLYGVFRETVEEMGLYGSQRSEETALTWAFELSHYCHKRNQDGWK